MPELGNKILIKISYLYYQAVDLVWSFYNRLIARLKGVNYGSAIKTKGYLFFFRRPGSKITVGNGCDFRSRENSNLIGISRSCMISTLSDKAEIIIGDNCGFSGVTIGAQTLVVIGKNCMVGANTIITDSDWHSINPTERVNGIPASRPTVIGDNVFIGVNSIILKGTTIGQNSVIGAGSVVQGSIPENVIAGGNPCKVLKIMS